MEVKPLLRDPRLPAKLFNADPIIHLLQNKGNLLFANLLVFIDRPRIACQALYENFLDSGGPVSWKQVRTNRFCISSVDCTEMRARIIAEIHKNSSKECGMPFAQDIRLNGATPPTTSWLPVTEMRTHE